MRQRLPFLAFFAFYLLFSLATFRDFGPTWDEQDTYLEGARLYDLLVQGKPMPFMDPEHSYPYAAFLHLFTAPDHYETLHLLNLFFHVLVFWALFECLLSFCGSGLWALAGPVFLFLDLPYMGSIPANPKDMPFSLFYFLSLAVLYLFERVFPQLRFRWVFLGLLFGLTMGSRILGFTLLPLLVAYDTALFLMKGKKKGKGRKGWWKKKAWEWAGVFLLSQLVCALAWPFIGADYFQHLPVVLWLSAHFPPKFSFLFMGGMSDSLTYPWYYLPLWILVTMPLFLVGFLAAALAGLPKGWKDPFILLLAGALGMNLGLYFLLHPAIYDGLRHFLFLLPLLAALSAAGFISFFQDRKFDLPRKGVLVLGAISVLSTTMQMVRLHPYEYTYFNELVGGFPGAYGRYETDYWVASMKEAALWLRENECKDPAKTYRVYADGKRFQSETYFGPNMVFEPKKEKADYAIIMTRAGFKPDVSEMPKVIHRVEREGAPLSFIVKEP
ncbi:MAG TPA: hypothetical protein VHE12_02080 [bacterium]|nr:hypothetical protein [bacterium]